MAIIRLQRRGMLTIPRDIRQRLQLHEGQSLVMRMQGERRIVIEILPILSHDDLFARYPILESVDNPDWHDGMAGSHGPARINVCLAPLRQKHDPGGRGALCSDSAQLARNPGGR